MEDASKVRDALAAVAGLDLSSSINAFNGLSGQPGVGLAESMSSLALGSGGPNTPAQRAPAPAAVQAIPSMALPATPGMPGIKPCSQHFKRVMAGLTIGACVTEQDDGMEELEREETGQEQEAAKRYKPTVQAAAAAPPGFVAASVAKFEGPARAGAGG
ncbi:hypothetical protein GPECTOR_63g2 [Gonium pectorale]|uniref:Uncharacterized protein n=1 Tax=Gonium pectorale TaxID=33097 RepID=A0A150G4E6_GONPE|nr:hypothetical protein GPECTOR_63g2 [Gonium pectorale]|eukprot:KXZ44691.1 hypothetical protein GPECTOR_63g2 [Gonium pectorale]